MTQMLEHIPPTPRGGSGPHCWVPCPRPRYFPNNTHLFGKTAHPGRQGRQGQRLPRPVWPWCALLLETESASSISCAPAQGTPRAGRPRSLPPSQTREAPRCLLHVRLPGRGSPFGRAGRAGLRAGGTGRRGSHTRRAQSWECPSTDVSSPWRFPGLTRGHCRCISSPVLFLSRGSQDPHMVHFGIKHRFPC